MPDYQQGKIYKIEPICEHEEGDIYVGSTTNKYLSHRMVKHRSEYKNRRFTNLSAFKLFDKYGVENCKILLLENYSCNSRDELNAKEGEYIRNMKCINKRIEGRTKKEYRDDNKEYFKQYFLEYNKQNSDTLKKNKIEFYNENKEHILEQHREKTICECGCEVLKYGMIRHQKTQRHINLINNTNKNQIKVNANVVVKL